jgi:Helicase HerA, central domain
LRHQPVSSSRRRRATSATKLQAGTPEEDTMDDPTNLLAFRRELYQRLPMAQVAYSSDGRHVAFNGPLELGLDVGDVAIVERPDSSSLVVQVHDVGIIEVDGAEVDVGMDGTDTGMGSVRARVRLRTVRGDAALLGSLTDGTFAPADAGYGPFGESPVRGPSAEELAAVADGLDGGAATVDVGTWRQAPSLTARLRSKGFARHTFMCGQSGFGKTYTTGVLFERLLAATTLPIVVLDPNSDHVLLDSVRDDDNQSPLAMLYRRVAASVRTARARGHEASYTLCADFSDLPLEFQAQLLRLHPIGDIDAYATLRRVTSSMSAPYSVADVAATAASDPTTTALAARIENLGIAGWSLWRRPGERSIVGVDLPSERCVVLDLGSLADPDKRTAVAFALLGARWARRHERRPTLLAIDEAHNVLPAATADPLRAATTELGVLIAGEGRKFGLHLFVATQRPSKVHPNVVSQCDNLVLMRMNGQADIDDLVTSFSHVPASMLRQATGFGLGQALVAGPISPVPQLVKVGTRLTAEGGSDVPTSWAGSEP